MNNQQKKGWWGRNWIWVVPVGCLGCIASCAGLVALFVLMIFGMLKSTGAYEEAVAKAKADAAVQKAIGVPVEVGMLVTGNIEISGPKGEADIAIPIFGPDGDATLYAVARKSAGQWEFSTLVVEVEETGESIDLLKDEEPEGGGEPSR